MKGSLMIQNLRSSLVPSLMLAFLLSESRLPQAIGGTLDQNHEINPVSAALTVSNTQDLAQTFAVGITGLLDRVDVQVTRDNSPTGPLTVQLRKTLSTGFPDDTAGGLLA